MASPVETMDWLAVQFRDNADTNPGEANHAQDATDVEEARAAFNDLLASLKMLDERGHTQATWQFALRAIARAEGGPNA